VPINCSEDYFRFAQGPPQLAGRNDANHAHHANGQLFRIEPPSRLKRDLTALVRERSRRGSGVKRNMARKPISRQPAWGKNTVLLAMLMAKDLNPISGRSHGVSREEGSIANAGPHRLQKGQWADFGFSGFLGRA
jgi:hypothetical protein